MWLCSCPKRNFPFDANTFPRGHSARLARRQSQFSWPARCRVCETWMPTVLTVIAASCRLQTLCLCPPACLSMLVTHCIAWGEGEEKKKTQTRCNQVHPVRYPIYLHNLKGSRRQTHIALGNVSADLLFRSRFSSGLRCVLWMLAKWSCFFFTQYCYSPIDAVCLRASGVFVKRLWLITVHSDITGRVTTTN